MYLKTTSPQFLQFGTTTHAPNEFDVVRNIYESKSVTNLHINNNKVSFQAVEGIAVLVVQDEDGIMREFVLHRRAILNENVPYAVFPLTSSALVEEAVQSTTKSSETIISTNAKIEHTPIRPLFYISDIFSYYYSVKGQNYHFNGESHYYWEITYVDTGELIVELDGQSYKLSSQDMIIYLPLQFHRHHVEEGKTCSYFTIMFDMNIRLDRIESLRHRVIHCTPQMYTLINDFIKQSNLLENYDIPFTRDLMVSYLQELIILMLQSPSKRVKAHNALTIPIPNTNPVQYKFENELIDEISNYILSEIYNPITVEDICHHFSISRSTLQSLFKKHLDVPPKQYINDMKMKQAQRIISEENIPITEVSLRLGFSSIHYFSRKFKKEFGISPSEFAQSVYKQDNK